MILNIFKIKVISNIKIKNSITLVSTDSFHLKIQTNNVTLILKHDNNFYTKQL